LKQFLFPWKLLLALPTGMCPLTSAQKYFAARIRGAKLTIFPGTMGHYVFPPV
jgi:hypothetical protein